MSANFTADVTSGCGPTEVHYENQSIGQNLTCTWVFPGGTPESSTEWNPVVTYSTEGLFDASLTITDGSESMSEMKEGFINIHTLPVVTISEIPVLCSFWDPVALTQGEPAGGVYSGNGVVDGFFYPQNVGAGSYEVTYTYTDAEFGCSNVATQLVVVDECTAIEEQVNGVALSILPNPTNGIFSINMSSATAKDVKVRVVNSLGKVVVDNVNLNVFGSTQQVIDLSGFARGVYFVQMESNGKTFNKKILVRD
jgi:PKD repeat protein